MRRPPPVSNALRPCDSVVARPGHMAGHYVGEQMHQEVIVYERSEAYLEYIVEYTLASD